MQHVYFKLAIPTDAYLAYYQGEAKVVSVIAEDGRRVEFPAKHLQKFVTHAGVYGRFELCFGTDNRFISLNTI